MGTYKEQRDESTTNVSCFKILFEMCCYRCCKMWSVLGIIIGFLAICAGCAVFSYYVIDDDGHHDLAFDIGMSPFLATMVVAGIFIVVFLPYIIIKGIIECIRCCSETYNDTKQDLEKNVGKNVEKNNTENKTPGGPEP